MLPTTTGSPDIDKAVVEVAGKVLGAVLEKSLGQLGRMHRWLWERYSTKDPFGSIGKQYAESIFHRYDQIRILGMDKPTSVRSLYVRLNLLLSTTANQRATVQDLEAAFEKDARGFGQIYGTEDGVAVVDSVKRLVVLGKPGAGKSTFLKWIALSSASGQLKDSKLPIFVSLRLWADSGSSLLDYLVDEVAVSGVEEPRLLVLELLRAGKAILLLDGLDEIGDAMTRAAAEIQKISDRYSEVSLVVSCRLAAFDYVLQAFTQVEIADFTTPQVKLFVDNWFGYRKDVAALCWQELSHQKNRTLLSLCSTPLLLTLLCLSFEGSLSFPTNRAELYREALDVLLKRWDSSRGIRRKSFYHDLSLGKKERLLTRIALLSFARSEYFMKQDLVEREIQAYVANLSSDPAASCEYESEIILKEIEAQHGLLVERARNIYSFSHLTLQEYFVAKSVTSNTNRKFGPTQLLDSHFDDPRWNVVISITAGLLDEADDFLVDLRSRTSKFAKSPVIVRFLNSLSKHIGERSTLTPTVARAVGVAHVMRSLAREYSWYKAAWEAATLILEDIRREYSPEIILRSEPIEVLKLDSVDAAWTVNKLIDGLVGLPHDHVNQLTSYLRSTRLVMSALSVDPYISAANRRAITESIFLEPYTPEHPRSAEG